jgi:hypothetical protein
METQETPEAVIALKKRILAEAPQSGIMVKERDKVFYLKEPGVDATLSGSGTIVFREGWGALPGVRRYGGFIRADEFLRKSGYRPYNIYAGMVYESYERQHKIAARDKERKQAVFTPVDLPKVTTKQIAAEQHSQEFSYPQISERPQIIPREMPQRVQQRGPQRSAPKEQPDRLGYFDILPRMDDPIKETASHTAFISRQLMDENMFANYSRLGYNNVLTLGKQLGVPNFGGKGPKAPGSKGSKGKGKGKKPTELMDGDMFE